MWVSIRLVIGNGTEMVGEERKEDLMDEGRGRRDAGKLGKLGSVRMAWRRVDLINRRTLSDL